MHKTISRTLAITGLLLLSSVSACAGEQAPSATRSPGKPLPPVSVELVSDTGLRAGVEAHGKILVKSRLALDEVEVSVEPASGMTISETRFYKRGEEISRGDTNIDFDFRPATDGPQPLRVQLRAVTADGRVMTRVMQFELGKPAQEGGGAGEIVVPEDYEASDEDVALPAEQEVIRGQ